MKERFDGVFKKKVQFLQELHFNRVRSRELEWVQQALEKVLLLLHHVLLDVTMGLASKVSGI